MPISVNYMWAVTEPTDVYKRQEHGAVPASYRVADRVFAAVGAWQMCIRDRPYSYQQEILDRLDAERTVRGYNRKMCIRDSRCPYRADLLYFNKVNIFRHSALPFYDIL